MSHTSVLLKSSHEQFRSAIAERGITPPKTIIGDGRRHRFSSNGDPGDDAGWYEFHDGLVASGIFGDFRTGVRITDWLADPGRILSQEEQTELHNKRCSLMAEKKARRERLQADARYKASCIMRVVTPADDNHPYLIRKNIKSAGTFIWTDPTIFVTTSKFTGKPFLQVVSKCGAARLSFSLERDTKSFEELCLNWSSILVVPLRDQLGVVQSVQLIAKDGDKKFLYGGKMQGCFFAMGQVGDAETILIAEGYATAASVHEITGHPTIVAFNAGNLLSVAKAIRAQNPEAVIILCADDDFRTKDNPGLAKAVEAAFAVQGSMLFPSFGTDRPETATDFNDMAAHLGKEAVTLFFYRAMFGEKEEQATHAQLMAG